MPELDQPRAEAAIRELLIAVGEDPDREGLRDTPARVARAYAEIFAGLYTDPDAVLDKTFDENHQEMVLVRDIPMFSHAASTTWCRSTASRTSATSPARTAGSPGCRKLARLVDLYAKRPQVQERLTARSPTRWCASSSRAA